MKVITKPVLTVDVPNEKNIVYPRAVVEQALAVARTKKFLCQLSMPDSLTFGFNTMAQASHIVESLYILEDTVFAELRVLDSTYGSMLQELNEKIDVPFGIAATADVKLRDDGVTEVTQMNIIGVHMKR